MAKSFSRRDFLRLATLTAGGTILVACGAPATTAAPSGNDATKPTAVPPAGEKISLRFWSHNNPAFVAINETLVKQFTAPTPTLMLYMKTSHITDFITENPDLDGSQE